MSLHTLLAPSFHFCVGLVSGYLKDMGCEGAYRAFLGESAHLREYASMLKRGRHFPTSIHGQSLQDMLHAFGRLQSEGEECVCVHRVCVCVCAYRGGDDPCWAGRTLSCCSFVCQPLLRLADQGLVRKFQSLG